MEKPKEDVIYEGELIFAKKTGGTIVYANDDFRGIYIPKHLFKNGEPVRVSITIRKGGK